MPTPFRGALETAAGFLWPQSCAVADCGRPADRPGRRLCSACFAALPFLEGAACEVCGAPIASSAHVPFVCDACRCGRPAYDRARSAVRYAAPVDRLINNFKYYGARWLLPDLAELLAGVVRAKFDAADIDLVTPVPLHWFRRLVRGYNQSALLATALADRLGRACDTRELVRERATRHQARIGGAERRKNMTGAFAVRDPSRIRRRTILLVDDVMTTGATLSECAAALKRAGAARVWCATVARSLPR